jgi:hypothetical protein
MRSIGFWARWVGYSVAIAVLVPFALFFLYMMYVAFYGMLRLPNWAVPPLLWHLPATGGYVDACPGPLAPHGLPEGGPEFNTRLLARFPLGSDETTVIGYLTSIGFEMMAPCDLDPTIHGAFYRQRIPGPTFVYFQGARVRWKVDPENRIVWIRGFTSYLPP